MCGQYADFNVLKNVLGDYPDIKGKILHTMESHQTILREYHDVHGHFSHTQTQEMI